MLKPGFIAYIDEAGDPGLNRVRPLDSVGASEWLVIGATVIHAHNEAETVDTVRSIRDAIGSRQGPDLHYRKLSDQRKAISCQILANSKSKSLVVASNKKNMKGHRNRLAEQYPGPKGWFYNWCVRVLLERITDLCAKSSISKYGQYRPVKLVFSERGAVQYRWLSAYIELLKRQSQKGTLVLTKRSLISEVVDTELIQIIPHTQSAGCQLADIVASAFFNAADTSGPKWNIQPAMLLKPCIATEGGFHSDYGVTLLPTPPWRANLTLDQQKIFEFYDYNFRP